MEQFDLTPQQFIDYKALKGDASDNIQVLRASVKKQHCRCWLTLRH